MLADRSGHLIEVAGRRPIRRRLNLEVATGTLEAVDLSHVLGAVNRIVDLQVLQSHFFVLATLLVRLSQVDIRVLWAFETALGILGSFLGAAGELRAFRNEAILTRTLVHNSIEGSHIVIGRGDHLPIQVELESRLIHSLAFGPAGRDAALQVELSSVLVLGRLGVHAA